MPSSGRVTGVTLAADGRRNELLAVWAETTPGSPGTTIRSRLFRRDGRPASDTTIVARGGTNIGGIGAAYGQRRFLVTYSAAGQDVFRAVLRAGSNRLVRRARVVARANGAIDPAYAPGTGTPEAGGLTTRQLLEFLRIIFDRLPVKAMDIVEVSPPLDCSDITSMAAIKVIYEVFGWLLKKRLKYQALGWLQDK